MGKKDEAKKLLQKLKDLQEDNADLQKALKALGMDYAEFKASSEEELMKKVNQDYDKLTQGGIIIVPVECPDGQEWDAAQGKCVPIGEKPPSGGTGGEEKDQYGITKIYPDKQGGKIISSGSYTENEFERHYASGKPSEWSFEYEYKSPKSAAISDGESTFYIKINGFKSEPDTISYKDLGPDHSDGNKAWLIYQVATDGKSAKNFQIENPHPKNRDNHQKTNFTIGEDLVGKWIGIKAINYKDGSDRKAEMWIDYPVADIANPPNNWRNYWKIDSIKGCDGGKDCIDPQGGNLLIRIDGTKKGSKPDVKYASKREINPSGSFPDIPPTTPPVTEPPTTTPEPPTTTTPPPEAGTLLYDSNTDGNWDKNPRVVTDKDGDISPNGKGIELHASGNPTLTIDGKGNADLQVDGGGHGRTYVFVKNYSGIYEEDLTFLDTNVENHTLQFRSRHNEGDPPEHRFGGISFKVDPSTVGTKIELFHNEHTDDVEKPLAKKISINQKVRVRCTFMDKGGGIYRKMSIDYNDGAGFKDVLEQTWSNPIPAALDKKSFEEQSYFWQRINPVKTGKIRMSNVKLYSL